MSICRPTGPVVAAALLCWAVDVCAIPCGPPVSSATPLAKGCNVSVEDTSNFFNELFDPVCLVQLSDEDRPCMLDSADHFFQAFGGQLRFDQLSVNIVVFVASAFLIFQSSTPVTDLTMDNTCKLVLTAFASLVFLLVQVAQAIFGLLSLLLAFCAYWAAAEAFKPCYQRDSSDSWAIMHVAVNIAAPFQPAISQRLALAALSLNSLAMASGNFSTKMLTGTFLLAKILMLIWLVAAVVSMLIMIFTLSVFFSIPFIGSVVPPFLTCVIVHVCIARFLGRFPTLKAAGSWMVEVDDWENATDKETAADLFWTLFWPTYPDTFVKIIIYSALVSTILSPMLCLGAWLAFDTYSGNHESTAVASAYAHHFQLSGFTWPDLLSFLEVASWDTVWDVLASLGDIIHIDPWKMLVASKIVLGLQTALSITKTLLVALNGCLRCLSDGNLGLPMKSVGEVVEQSEEVQTQIEFAQIEFAGSGNNTVVQYRGFKEHAYRLLFPYEDNFPDKEPHLLTITPGGGVVTTKTLTAEKERGLLSWTWCQFVDEEVRDRVVEIPYSDWTGKKYGDTPFVSGLGKNVLVQLWPTKMNEKFKQDFRMTESNPDTKKFESTAVVAFKACIQKLFGAEATQKIQIQYCHKTTDNNFPCYVGPTESLLQYLKNNTGAMNAVGIKEMRADGFLSSGEDGKGAKVEKEFRMLPRTLYVVYKKVGWETMGCCKTKAQFDKECDFVGLGEKIDVLS